MADNVNNSNTQNDIINNLLVKDELGTLHSLSDDNNVTNPTMNDQKEQVDSPDSGSLTADIEKMITAPEDDNFKEHPMPTGNAQDKSELVFHPEDKEQILNLANATPVDDSKKYSVEKIIDKIVDKQQLQLEDENRKLFTNTIFDFFRNRKNAIVARQFIQGRINTNGQKIDEVVLDNIMSVVKDLKSKIDNSGGLVVKADEFVKQAIKETPVLQPDLEKNTVEAQTMEPEDVPSPVDAMPEVESQIMSQPVVEERENEAEEETLSPIAKDTEVGDDEIKKFRPPVLEENDASDSGVVAPESINTEVSPESTDEVKKVEVGNQGIQSDLDNILNGDLNEEESGASMADDDQSAIAQSLAEIQGIMPEAKVSEETKVEDDLLKELAVEDDKQNINSEVTDNVSPKEDLHDVGQLMMEDDKDPVVTEEQATQSSENQEENLEDIIQKIKPANSIDNTASESEVEKSEEVEPEVSVENLAAVAENVDIPIESPEISNEIENKEEQAAKDKGPVVADVPLVEPETAAKDSPSLPRVIRPGQTFTVKPNLNDVQKTKTNPIGHKTQHVLTGPVEELSNMTLKNFRFLGANAEDRVNKILEKISILEQDSYTKKAAGIKGWRQSPIYQMYLMLGADSMAEGKDISVLINEKKAAGEDILDIEEFSAISDLNKSLRF